MVIKSDQDLDIRPSSWPSWHQAIILTLLTLSIPDPFQHHHHGVLLLPGHPTSSNHLPWHPFPRHLSHSRPSCLGWGGQINRSLFFVDKSIFHCFCGRINLPPFFWTNYPPPFFVDKLILCSFLWTNQTFTVKNQSLTVLWTNQSSVDFVCQAVLPVSRLSRYLTNAAGNIIDIVVMKAFEGAFSSQVSQQLEGTAR